MYQVKNNKIIYQEKNEILGFVEFKNIDLKTVDIVHTFVNPKYRKKVIGKHLLDYTFQYFKKQKINMIYSCSYAKKYQKQSKNSLT